MSTQLNHSTECWAIVPAAGIGTRMESEIPKQYLQLAGKTILEHTINRLLDQKEVKGVVIALAENDQWWKDINIATDKKLITVVGGKERCHSVLNALQKITELTSKNRWVLVHDAARPCVQASDISHLIAQVIENKSQGGVLGMSVRDTMKRTDKTGRVNETISRENLWHAHTPQLFNVKDLNHAMTDALDKGLLVTDEASAMEAAGYKPLMVEGQASNIKITHPSDLKLAEFFLNHAATN